MKKQTKLLLSICFLITSKSALSLTLAEAIAAKKVCERNDGYIQATSNHENEIASLLSEVNQKRSEVYTEIAQKEKISLKVVGIEMARKEKQLHPEKFCR